MFFFGCSNSSDIDLLVENNTEDNLQIIYSKYGNIDTSRISSGTKLVIVNLGDIGQSTEGKLDLLEAIPLDILEIRNENGAEYNKDLLDINLWEKIYPEHKGEEGKVFLKIVEEDFE